MDDARRARIAELCSVGDLLAEQKDLPAALMKFREALAIIPRPVELYDEATRVLTAIGDACFHLGLFSESRHALHGAMRSAGGRGVPFLHMRLGQCELELGNLGRGRVLAGLRVRWTEARRGECAQVPRVRADTEPAVGSAGAGQTVISMRLPSGSSTTHS
jgi:hypothetical protein